jgi:hypothetical protein
MQSEKVNQELNENIYFIAENLNCLKSYYFKTSEINLETLSQSNDQFLAIFNDINRSIKICLKCNQVMLNDDTNELKRIKLEIFSHLLNRDCVVQTPTLSIDLFVQLIIENCVENIFEVKFIKI